MAKKKGYGYQNQGNTRVVRPMHGADGKVIQYSLNTADLEPPQREFYANTARFAPREWSVTFVFGQFFAGSDAVYAALGIEVPRSSLPSWIETFTPNFRDAIRGSHQFAAFPTDANLQSSLTYPAHILRAVVNDQMGVLDFYEIVPNLTAPPDVTAAIRIKAPPSIVRFFVEQCDRAADGTL